MTSAFFAVIVALALVGETAAQPAPYEINALIPLTGGGAFLGKAYTQAFEAVENVVNKSGGIQGRPLKFVYGDTQTNPAVDVQLVNGLIAKHAPVFIDGGPAGVCSASVPVVVKTGPVDYCLSPGVHPPSGSYVFSSNVSTDDLVKVLLHYFRDRGWTRLAVISSTDTTGQDFDRQIGTTLALPENKGVAIVAQEHFATTDISVGAQMSNIKAAKPQVVVTWSTGAPFGTLLRGINDAGIDVPVSSTSGDQLFAQMSAYADFLPKQLYFPGTLAMTPPTSGRGPVYEAQVAYAAAFRAINAKPDLAHDLVWDPALIIVDAVRHIGPAATAEQIRDYILGLRSWAGINGIYNFTTGDQRGIGINAAAVDLWDASKVNWVQVSRPGGAKP